MTREDDMIEYIAAGSRILPIEPYGAFGLPLRLLNGGDFCRCVQF